MIKLIYIIDDLLIGGAQEVLLTTLKAINRERFNPVVVTLFCGGPIGEEIRKTGVPVKVLGMKNKYDFKILFKLMNLIKKEKAQIVHTHLIIANFYGRLAAKLARVPVIVATLHNIFYERPAYYIWSDRWMHPFSDRIITVSEAVKNWIIDKEKVSQDKFATIHNAIDLAKFDIKIDKNKKKEEMSLDKNISLIMTIGTLDRMLDVETILRALPGVLKEIPEVKLLILGDGPIKNNLEKLTRNLRIKDQVIFYGWRRDIPELFSITDLFVTLPVWEAFGIVLLEAMIMAKPVIATNRGGISEIVKNGENGFLIAPGNIQSLTRTIIKLVKDKKLNRQMGERGRELVQKRFNSAIMADKLEKLYDLLIKEKGVETDGTLHNCSGSK